LYDSDTHNNVQNVRCSATQVPEAEKINTVEELQQSITEKWKCIDQRVIDNAVKQWHKPAVTDSSQ